MGYVASEEIATSVKGLKREMEALPQHSILKKFQTPGRTRYRQ